jgi:hypothetical protein
LQTTKKEETEETQRENNKGNKKKHKEEKEEIPNMLYQRIVGLCLVLGLFVQGSMGASMTGAEAKAQMAGMAEELAAVQAVVEGQAAKIAPAEEEVRKATDEARQATEENQGASNAETKQKVAQSQSNLALEQAIEKTLTTEGEEFKQMADELRQVTQAHEALKRTVETEATSDPGNPSSHPQEVITHRAEVDALLKKFNPAVTKQLQGQVTATEKELDAARERLVAEEKAVAAKGEGGHEKEAAAVVAEKEFIGGLETQLDTAHKAVITEVNKQTAALKKRIEAPPKNAEGNEDTAKLGELQREAKVLVEQLVEAIGATVISRTKQVEVPADLFDEIATEPALTPEEKQGIVTKALLVIREQLNQAKAQGHEQLKKAREEKAALQEQVAELEKKVKEAKEQGKAEAPKEAQQPKPDTEALKKTQKEIDDLKAKLTEARKQTEEQKAFVSQRDQTISGLQEQVLTNTNSALEDIQTLTAKLGEQEQKLGKGAKGAECESEKSEIARLKKELAAAQKTGSAGPKQTTSTSYETTTTSAASSSFISGFIAAVVSANLIFGLLFA